MRSKGLRKSYRLRGRTVSPEIHNNWEISYGDMVTLLLGFFVIFFNIRNDPNHLQVFLDQFKNQLNITSESSQNGNDQQSILQIFEPLADEIKTYPYQSGNRLIIEFPGISFFDAGQIELTKDGENALKFFSQRAKNFKGHFRYVVRGYTDNKPSGKTSLYKDNLELSAFRSITAIRYLKKMGISLSDMRIGGYGETDHSERTLPPEIRKADRKIVIVIEPLDRTERTTAFATNEKEEAYKTLCQIDEKSMKDIQCFEKFNVLPKNVTWLEPKAKTRNTASFLKTKTNEKTKKDWLHDNFLYRMTNDYYYLRDNGENHEE